MSSCDDHPSMRKRIDQLVAEKYGLFILTERSDDQARRLREIRVELAQCWEVLRRRRSLLASWWLWSTSRPQDAGTRR